MKTRTDNAWVLKQIIIWGSSLAGGFGAASMQALQPNLSFALSFKTLIAFVCGLALVATFWKSIFHPLIGARRKFLRVVTSVLLVAGGFAGVLYPLRFVAPSQFPALITGLSVAVCALGGVATLLYLCKRFLDEDERKREKTTPLTPIHNFSLNSELLPQSGTENRKKAEIRIPKEPVPACHENVRPASRVRLPDSGFGLRIEAAEFRSIGRAIRPTFAQFRFPKPPLHFVRTANFQLRSRPWAIRPPLPCKPFVHWCSQT